jgi:hypothetical protein
LGKYEEEYEGEKNYPLRPKKRSMVLEKINCDHEAQRSLGRQSRPLLPVFFPMLLISEAAASIFNEDR